MKISIPGWPFPYKLRQQRVVLCHSWVAENIKYIYYDNKDEEYYIKIK